MKVGIDSKTITGNNHFTIAEVQNIYDEATAYKYHHGKAYPGLDSPTLQATIRHLSALNFNFWFPSRAYTAFFADSMTRLISDTMTRRSLGLPSPAFTLLSGHQFNLYAYLLLLNVTDVDCCLEAVVAGVDGCCETVEFAAAVRFEMWVEGRVYTVRVLYNDRVLMVCGREYCGFEEFLVVMRGLFYDEESKLEMCANPMLKIKVLEHKIKVRLNLMGWIIVGVFTVIIVAKIIIFIVMHVIHSRRHKLESKYQSIDSSNSVF